MESEKYPATTTATMKLMSDTVPGLMIIDIVDKIHGTVLGALVSLSDEDMHLGNGLGQFYYCDDVLQEA